MLPTPTQVMFFNEGGCSEWEDEKVFVFLVMDVGTFIRFHWIIYDKYIYIYLMDFLASHTKC